MREWCIQYPWMTFFILTLTIWCIDKNIRIFIEGKNRLMENFSIKGGIKMPNKNSNGSKQSGGEKRIYTNDGGSQSVPPSQSSSPPKPSRQK